MTPSIDADMSGATANASRLSDAFQIKQKRARGQLSCTPCRVGKLKCNRMRDPACDQCIKRNREGACHYVPPPAKAKPAANVKGRIRQLETLVKDLMVQQQSQSGTDEANHADQPTPPSDNDLSLEDRWRDSNVDANVEHSFGRLEISKEEISYKGENHWQTILSSLNDIQKDLADDDDDTPERPDEPSDTNEVSPHIPTPISMDSPPSATEFILGRTKAMTRQELIRSVPEKRITDRLLSLWFNSPDPFKNIIHAPTFQEEYKQFWRDQSNSTMWLGLLFSLLCQAESFGLRNATAATEATQRCLEKVDLYQSLATSALVLADYTKPKEYTLECLLMYMVSLRIGNASMNAWLVMGIIVRLAFRMGYHRDPGHYPKLTAFQAEMRRRTWALIFMIDTLMSFQLGLPSMLRTITSDTLPPKNLLDRDFNPGMVILPNGRGEHEVTPSLYTRAKLRLMSVFSEAAELSHSTQPPSFETVLKLDRDLEQARKDVPHALHMPDISELVTDQAEQLTCRFNLDLLYHKSKIVLFRRYMLVPIDQLSKAEQEQGIGEGRLACIHSARTVLDHHHTIWSAIQPGGQLENMKWYMGSISTHDFLLAAMVVCLELSQQLESDKLMKISSKPNCPYRSGMMRALQQSHDIWASYSGLDETETLHINNTYVGWKGGVMVNETTKARKVMRTMLNRLKQRFPALDCAATVRSPEANQEETSPESPTYFERMGLTRESAKVLREQGSSNYGVLTTHDWGDIPESFQYSNLESSRSPSVPQNIDSILGNQQPAGDDQGLPDYNNIVADLGDDPMNLDWEAWDNEIFSVPAADMMQWNNQASPAAYAQISQSLAPSTSTSVPQEPSIEKPIDNLLQQQQLQTPSDRENAIAEIGTGQRPLAPGSWIPFIAAKYSGDWEQFDPNSLNR